MTHLYIDFNEMGIKGAKYISKGLQLNTTLKVLSIKGNWICDDGALFLAEILKENHLLKELDISYNEIGPIGFQGIYIYIYILLYKLYIGICESINSSVLTTLISNKNPLQDESLYIFGNMVREESCPLKKFELCSCKMSDRGLIYLLNALQSNPKVTNIKLNDNYFSENIEVLLIDTLNKNSNLIEIGFAGNRFSHSCLKKYIYIYIYK